MRRLFTLAILASLLSLGSGCVALHRIAYQPLGPTGPLAAGRGACGPMACGPTECVEEVGCGSCGEVGCCDDACGHYGPYRPFAGLACVLRLFRPVTWCGPACGERYWGDFYSDPPDCWDPCDPCGNFTGERPPKWPHCPRRFSLFGFCSGRDCGGCGGCIETCGAVGDCGCEEVGCDTCAAVPGLPMQPMPDGCSTCLGSSPRYGTSTPMRQPRAIHHASGDGPVLPAPKLISVTDKVVESAVVESEQKSAGDPLVAKRPTKTYDR